MQNETLIDSLPLLSGLTREDAAAVKDAVLSVVKEYSSGEVILAEECFSPSLLFVRVGRASVTVRPRQPPLPVWRRKVKEKTRPSPFRCFIVPPPF